MRFLACVVIFSFLLAGCGSENDNSMGQPSPIDQGQPSPIDQEQPSIPLTALPQTGQSVCYDISSVGAIIACDDTGQDGETRAGAAWPVPRFVSIGQEVFRDELTGLEWASNRNAPGPAECSPDSKKSWEEAFVYVECINQSFYLGHSDWRLPNVQELSSMLNADLDTSFYEQLQPTGFGYAWTSTTRANDPTLAYRSLAEGGYISYRTKTDLNYVWPVRSGQAGRITLPRTGQTTCYDSSGATIECNGTGQDGDIMVGREWPIPRFTDNEDGTITDELTDLKWAANTDFPYSEVCSPGSSDFLSTVNYIKCLNSNNYLGFDDWRLPNEFEVRSLGNYNLPSSEKSNWLAGYGFHNFSSLWVQTWSSTVEDGSGFPIGIWVGGGHWEFDFPSGHAWPVRGGFFQ